MAAVDAYRRITLDGRTFLEPLPLLRPLVLALPLSNERTRACPCKSSMEDHLGSSLSGFGPRRRDDDGRVEKLAAAQRGALYSILLEFNYVIIIHSTTSRLKFIQNEGAMHPPVTSLHPLTQSAAPRSKWSHI